MRREAIYPHRSVRSLPLKPGLLLTALAAATAMTLLIFIFSDSLLAEHNEIVTEALNFCRIPVTATASIELFPPVGQTQANITDVFHLKDNPSRTAILVVGSILILLVVHRKVELARNFLVFVMALIVTTAGV